MRAATSASPGEHPPKRVETSDTYPLRVRVLDIDADLLSRTPPELGRRLRPLVTCPAAVLARGSPLPTPQDDEPFLAFYVASGLLMRATTLGGKRAVDLMGPGDVARPMEAVTSDLLPVASEIVAIEESLVALLDATFERQISKAPGVAGQIVGRAVTRARRLAIQHAIVGHNDLEVRIWLMLWHLAERWGIRTPAGTRLELPLSHGLLADLVRANRSNVSRRIGQLRARGCLCTADDVWLLLAPVEALGIGQ
jgi:CRP/FNR family cyclic AMP-dependent transcriptional regulator